MINQYMESGYYPHVRRDWKATCRVLWRIVRYGDFFPQPEPWYESFHNLMYSPIGMCCKRAVEKVNREYLQDKTTRSIRRREAQEWAVTYAKEAGVWSHGMREGTFNLLIEWWAARLDQRV